MKDLAEMTVYELEEKLSELMDSIMECDNEDVLDTIQEQIDEVRDELDERDLLEDEW